MVIKTQDEMIENIKSFVGEYQALLLQKKEIDESIKELKDNYKEDGVPVGVVSKVLNKIKAQLKMSESDRLEEEIIMEKLEADENILVNIEALIAK